MNPTIITSCVQRRPNGEWSLKVQFDFQNVDHERTQRTYASPDDAITSSRHLVKELTKPRMDTDQTRKGTKP